VNVAGEGSKFGFSPERLREHMESLLALSRLSILGLMTIPPLANDAEASRKYFVELRELRDRLQTEFRVDLAQLSMGMTNDFGGDRGRSDTGARRHSSLWRTRASET